MMPLIQISEEGAIVSGGYITISYGGYITVSYGGYITGSYGGYVTVSKHEHVITY